MGFWNMLEKSVTKSLNEKSVKNFLEEKVEKHKIISEYVENMSEEELIHMYKTAKRKGEILATGRIIRELKEKYGYTSEDINNI